MSNPYGLSDAGYGLYTGIVGIFGQNNVVVTSGGRSASYNATIPGSSSTSQHIGGNALDFEVPGYTSEQVANIVGSSGMQYGQLIGYTTDNHVHIGVGTKGQDLLKTAKGYVSTVWGTAKTLLSNSSGKAIANAIAPGTGDALAAAAGVGGGGSITDGLGITGSCDWFCQLKNWLTDTQFFQRVGIVILALVLILMAFYLLGTGQIQKMVKSS